MRKNISTVILWGAIWGLIEATLGYVLHSLSLKVGWFFWFPLAFFFLERVFKQTGSPASILCTSAIAASIKLVNFLLPTSIDRVINPAVSIILEGLAVFAVFKIIEHKPDFFRFKYLEALAMSVGWRALYIFYILLMPASFLKVSPLRATGPFMKFFLLESITNSLIIYAYIKIKERINERKVKGEQLKEEGRLGRTLIFMETNTVFKVFLSFFMLALALYAQWAL